LDTNSGKSVVKIKNSGTLSIKIIFRVMILLIENDLILTFLPAFLCKNVPLNFKNTPFYVSVIIVHLYLGIYEFKLISWA